MSSPTKQPRQTAGYAGSTSIDEFLGGRIAVVQPQRGHRAGSDAVFLAAAVQAGEGERVLDVGAGVGVAGLCLLARIPKLHVTAVDVDEGLCGLARENAARNGFAAQFKAIRADVTSPGRTLAALGLRRESYNHVIANPPFYAEGSIRPAPDEGRTTAHVMRGGALSAWVRFFATMAAPDGMLTLIHRPERLGQLLEHLAGRFGGIVVFPLFPKQGGGASRIILQGRKGSRSATSLLPGLVLHDQEGRYTAEAEAILRGGKALPLGLLPKAKKGRRLGGKRRQPS